MSKEEAYKCILAAWKMYSHFTGDWNDFAKALNAPEIREACRTQFGRDLIYAVKEELEREAVNS